MLEEVYSIALKKKDTIAFKNKEFKVNNIIYKECVLFTKLHAVIIGIMTVLGLATASLANSNNFFIDLIYVVIFIIGANFILDRLFYFLLLRRCNNE